MPTTAKPAEKRRRVLSRDTSSTLALAARVTRKEPLLEAAGLPGGDRPRGAAFIERDPARVREVEKSLPFLPLLGGPEEEPGEEAQRQQTALDHHHHPGRRLIREPGDPPLRLSSIKETAVATWVSHGSGSSRRSKSSRPRAPKRSLSGHGVPHAIRVE